MKISSRIAVAFAVALLVAASSPALAVGRTAPVVAASIAAPSASALQESGASTFPAAEAQEVSRQSVHEEAWWVVIARLLNFAILVGVLVYFLRAPIADYLSRRSTEIRAELVKAAETRERASAELAEIERKVKSLPSDIEALKRRGAEEIAAEEARIRKAADAERQRLLDQARHEIDLQVRTAERDLVKHAADLAVDLASDRIKKTITDEDQRRLVDRYLGQVRK